MFESFTDKAMQVILLAQEESRQLGQRFVGSEQILLGLVAEETSFAASILEELGLTYSAARAEVERTVGCGTGFVGMEIPFTPKAKAVLEQAIQEARQLAHNFISPEHLLLGLLKDADSVAIKVLQNLDIDLVQVRVRLLRVLGEAAAVPVSGGRKVKANRSQGKALAEFGTDLTQLAAAGQIDPLIGRQREIERVTQILGRRTKNNPVLIGEPGVGKTAIAEGLAQRLASGDVPPLLADKRVISLDLGGLVAGTRFRGEFEERLSQVMAEVRQTGNVILVIDEIHTLVGAGALDGGGLDAANLLKPALARGELQCIGATTLDEYRQYVEQDAALERRFQPVMVDEPTVEETITILRGVRENYEKHHRLKIEDAALEAAAQLSDRYIADRYLPDKAIDLIDEAGSRVHLRHAMLTKSEGTEPSTFPVPSVKVEDIAQVLSAWTGVPVQQLTETERARLLHLEAELHQRVVGQEEAVKALARALRRSRAGLKALKRPLGSFIFCGPTGVGKTELAKALAECVFGSEGAMVRLDMSEYMEPQSTAKLIGSPPGYVGYGEGGKLTEAVRRRPYTLLLFDEIEKAHPDTFNLLLQLLEDGRLTDSQGRVVDFKNTLIIMTSNLGSRAIEKSGSGMGFEVTGSDAATAQYQRTREQVNESLKQAFRPELLNRLDDIIVFRQLTREEVSQIADLLLQQVSQRLAEREIALEVTPALKERLVAEGYDPSYGARLLRRAISRLVEDYLAEAILAGEIGVGDTAIIDVTEGVRVQVRRKPLPALAAFPQS